MLREFLSELKLHLKMNGPAMVLFFGPDKESSRTKTYL